MLRVATVNVNGIRAAARRGMGAWLAERSPDLLCLQEVRADDHQLTEAVGPGWHGVHAEALTRGRAGVAVLSRTSPHAVRVGLPETAGPFDGTGRWVELDLTLDATSSGAGLLTVISAYVHTGQAGTARQEEKYHFLDAAAARVATLVADGRHVVLTGDLNVAHREVDLKNWKGNRGKAGFLPQERAWFDRLLDDAGWVDVHRVQAGPGPGPYTWWSWRGKAFDNDSGWRIDYQLASPDLGARVVACQADRASSYAERWSDHAPVIAEYGIDVGRPVPGDTYA